MPYNEMIFHDLVTSLLKRVIRLHEHIESCYKDYICPGCNEVKKLFKKLSFPCSQSLALIYD